MCDDGQRQSTAVQCTHRLPSITERSLCNSVSSVCAARPTEGRERDGEEREKVCVCVRGGGREWEGSLSDRHLPAVCVMQRWLGLLCVSVCVRDCTWLSGVCEWTAA